MTTLYTMEPLVPEDRRQVLEELATELVDRAGRLAGRVHPVMQDSLGDLATIGFEQLAQDTGSSSKSLMRMLSPAGNPTASNLFAVLQSVQKASGLSLSVSIGR